MDAAERQAMAELRQELGQLRTGAMRAASGLAPERFPCPSRRQARPCPRGPARQGPAAVALDLVEAARMDEVSASLNTGPWRFRDGKTITLVCAQLPNNLRAADEYTDLDSPDYIQLYTYSELDALFELYGHLRAANPANQVDLRIADLLTPDEYYVPSGIAGRYRLECRDQHAFAGSPAAGKPGRQLGQGRRGRRRLLRVG